ncbi:hypothetical protein GQ55_9G458600 [Panicum hallii var. hallii]|uniref:Uncharacterized protein n=1 Tax=Panicum hallii var. hallii TaxID=1504633 RepID=A0A2T7CC19_9POAL|nr:hypothetical protein GQ55_9G458600 [Panicum hallii var. hallii]
MVKTDYRNLCGLPPSCDVLHRSPSSPSDFVDSSENGMDPSNISVTPGSSGSSSDGNGGSSVHTSSRRRRLMSSSPTGTQLAAADGGGSRSSTPSSSSTGPDLEPHSRHPEDSPPNQVRRLLLISPVHSPAATDDDVLIMDGVLVDNGAGTPSSARRSVSFVDNNGPSNRRSVSNSDLVLVSSGSQRYIGAGSSGGSGGRRSCSSGQIPQREEPRVTQAQRNRHSEVGSQNRRRQHQGAGPSNINQGQEFINPLSMNQGQEFINPFSLPHYTSPYYGQWLPYYTYGPPMVSIHPAGLYGGLFDIRRHPPSGVNITHPDGTPLQLPRPPPPPPPRGSTVVIAPPPAPEQPETQPPPPAPEQPETPPPPPQEPSAQTFCWPPTAEETAAIEAVLYGPSTSGWNRLPVFKEICPDDDANQALPPPPPPPPAPPCP